MQIFQLLRFGTLLLISIVFAKSNLSTEEIGSYEMFLFVAALLTSFWINGLIQSFLPLYRNNNTFEKQEERSPEIFNVFLLISVFSLLVILLLVVFKDPLSVVLTDSGEIPYFKLILVYIFFSSPSYLTEYIYLASNEAFKILVYGITSFFIQFVLIVFPAVMGYGMEYSIFGLVISAFLRYIWLIGLLSKYALFSPSAEFIKEHIHFAFPLIISTLLGSSAQYVDGFLVLNRFDTATFAVFKYGAREFPLVLLLANALSTAMISEFSKNRDINASLTRLRKKSVRLMHILFPVTILFLAFSEWLYPRVFNENFVESAKVFNIYLLLIICRLVFPQTILTGMKKTRILMVASLAELFVNVILSILFIRFWGIEGIAFATVIAFATQKLIFMVYNKSVLGIKVKSYVPTLELGIYSLLVVCVYIFVV